MYNEYKLRDIILKYIDDNYDGDIDKVPYFKNEVVNERRRNSMVGALKGKSAMSIGRFNIWMEILGLSYEITLKKKDGSEIKENTNMVERDLNIQYTGKEIKRLVDELVKIKTN